MSLALSPELEMLIREKVASGGYRDANEVVAEAMSLLDGRESDLSEEVHQALDAGEADIAAGRVIVLNTPEDLKSFFQAL